MRMLLIPGRINIFLLICFFILTATAFAEEREVEKIPNLHRITKINTHSQGQNSGPERADITTQPLPKPLRINGQALEIFYQREINSRAIAGQAKNHFNQNDWTIETVDSWNRVGGYISLTLDSQRYPHIVYHDYTNADLKYAYWDGAQWIIQTLDEVGEVGIFTSIALDANDYPHISYCWFTTDYSGTITDSNLRYIYWDGTNWIKEIVDISGTVGLFSSIALDSKGYPHISYFDASYSNLKYAYKDESGWHTETVKSSGYVGMFCSLALDNSDSPHISYTYMQSSSPYYYRLKYSYRDGSGWHHETVDSYGDVGDYTSIAIDSYQYPHISYHHYGYDNLKYAYKDASGWHTETVESYARVGIYTNIALDGKNNPHISYAKFSATSQGYINEADLKYAHYEDQWQIETVDAPGVVGLFSSIAIGTYDSPHIGYYDATNGDLKYAHKVPSAIEAYHDNGDALSFYSHWKVGDIVATKLPTEYENLKLTTIKFMLYNFKKVASQQVRIHVYQVNEDGSVGTELAVSGNQTITTFYPDWATVDVSSLNFSTSQMTNLFIGIEYVGGIEGSIPSVVMDSQLDITSKVNYYYANGTWNEHYEFWTAPDQVGYNMIRAKFEFSQQPMATSGGSFSENIITQNYPNPFNPITTIQYKLLNPSNVTITIYNILGQKVETLLDEFQQAGLHEIQWNAQNVSSGLYFYQIEAGRFRKIRKMIVEK